MQRDHFFTGNAEFPLTFRISTFSYCGY